MKFGAMTTALVAFVVSLTAVYFSAVVWFIWPINTFTIEKIGALGDSFGVVNTLFSGLAFVGLIVTILLQRFELNESRKIFKKQRFEDGFYRLLDFYQRNLNSIVITDHDKNEVHQGIDGLVYIHKKLTSAMEQYQHFLNEVDTKPVYEYYLFIEIQKIILRQSRYLGTLESLLKKIDSELETIEEKEVYRRILVSQITAVEMKYIFYQCLVAPENNSFRQLVEKSNLFQHHSTGLNISQSLSKLYKKCHGIEYKKARERRVPIQPYKRKEIRRILTKYRKSKSKKIVENI